METILGWKRSIGEGANPRDTKVRLAKEIVARFPVYRTYIDGSTPADNPFFNTTANLTGEAAANIKKLFAYGVRNSFGMDFDPLSGA